MKGRRWSLGSSEPKTTVQWQQATTTGEWRNWQRARLKPSHVSGEKPYKSISRPGRHRKSLNLWNPPARPLSATTRQSVLVSLADYQRIVLLQVTQLKSKVIPFSSVLIVLLENWCTLKMWACLAMSHSDWKAVFLTFCVLLRKALFLAPQSPPPRPHHPPLPTPPSPALSVFKASQDEQKARRERKESKRDGDRDLFHKQVRPHIN